MQHPMAVKQFNVQWAYSGWKTFNTCAKQYLHKYILKDVSDPPGPEAEYGTRVHKAFEDYLAGRADFPIEHAQFRKYADAVAAWKGDLYVEHKMALDFNMEPCDFFDKNYFVRGVVDLASINGAVANILDWKTGKSAKYADLKQLELMSLLIFKHFPQVQRTKAGLVFLVPDKIVKARYDKKDEQALWLRWMYEVSRIQQAKDKNNFGPSPNNLCKRHCPVLSCDFNQRVVEV